jgi:hypothetical protein
MKSKLMKTNEKSGIGGLLVERMQWSLTTYYCLLTAKIDGGIG